MTAPAKPASSSVVKTGQPPQSAAAVRSNGDGPSIGALIERAIDKGVPVENLERLIALHERVADRNAALEFASAMAAFQAECPPIHKSSKAKIVTSKGGTYEYAYAELDEIARTINPILAKHGLSYTWDSKVEGGILTCVCTVRHINGHAVTSSFMLPIENPSAMNPQQKVAAALTFAKRQTLTSALGLVTTDDDPDAASVDPTPITEDQFIVLDDLLRETKTNRVKFLEFMGVDSLEKVPAARFKEALNVFEQKKARGK